MVSLLILFFFSAQSLGQAAQAVALAISQLLGTISSARAEHTLNSSPPKEASDDEDELENLSETELDDVAEPPQPVVPFDGPAR